jgi:hypothetical protein
MKKYPVVIVKWEESELGWGVRPDGYSLHLTVGDSKAFIDDYWKSMPDEVPEEYSRPSLSSNATAVDVDEKTYKKIKKSKNGIRIYSEYVEGGKS